jgi:Ca2+-binding EF-hand superfamily protein
MNAFDRNLLNLTMTTLLSTLAAATALAEPATKDVAPSFKTYDSDGDGMVSPEEFVAQRGDERSFRAADANRDNRLSNEEFGKVSTAQDRP